MIFELDVSSLIPPDERARFDLDALRGFAGVLASAARAQWIVLAGRHLRRTSQDYVRGIQQVEFSSDGASVTLVGRWPNMIEHGFGPFDMRDTLLGPNVPVVPIGEKGKHRSKDGHFFRAIPFRLMSPTATGRNAQKVTEAYANYLGKKAAEDIGRKAWREMKKLAGPGQQGPKAIKPGQVTDIKGRSHVLDKYGIVATPTGQAGVLKHAGPEHKTDLFAGARKMGAPGHTHFGTFRSISTGEPDGWIHPGFQPGAQLAPLVQAHVQRQVPALLEKFMSGTKKG